MPEGNRVVREWDDAAESWVDFVRQGKDYFRDELNNPEMFRMIGDVEGQLVLDVACGEGYSTRILACKGARVTGIDLSKELIEYAKSQEEKDAFGIDYYVTDSADLSRFPAKRFDLVTCFMAMMDIEHYDEAIGEIARVMKDDARFIFSITHPCFGCSTKSGKIEETARYFEARSERVPWKMERLLRPFETTSFHRTLTDYSNALNRHGLLIGRLLEPKPTRKGLAKFPPLKQVLLRPHSIIFETVKNKTRNRSKR
ncbi:MAG TPA: class I SAM-dependent methyltransferase [candidate division Zixibacteria bacterium]|nr:class I SAM-dependent methyltransferase [candidate division Zixibacteria bacterium]